MATPSGTTSVGGMCLILYLPGGGQKVTPSLIFLLVTINQTFLNLY